MAAPRRLAPTSLPKTSRAIAVMATRPASPASTTEVTWRRSKGRVSIIAIARDVFGTVRTHGEDTR